jgi:hypothetical protein
MAAFHFSAEQGMEKRDVETAHAKGENAAGRKGYG